MHVVFSSHDLRPLIAEVVAELAQTLAPMDDRLSVDEQEAARLLGLQPHVLRDARLRGEIRAAKVGKRRLYLRGDLIEFLQSRKSAGDRR